MKTPIYTGIFQSDLDASGYKLIGLPTPVSSGDAATKAYVDAHAGGGGGGTNPMITANVKDLVYGAVGDGVTDDSAAIQSAINAVCALGGGTVFFPRGTYLCNGAFNGSANSILTIPFNPSSNGTNIPLCFLGETQPEGLGCPIIKSTKAGTGTMPAILSAGPYAGTGPLGPTSFNSTNVYINNLEFRLNDNPSISAIRLDVAARAALEDVWVQAATMSVHPTSPVVGVFMPVSGNYVFLSCKNVFVGGFDTGIKVGEHFRATDIFTYRNNIGIEFLVTNNGPSWVNMSTYQNVSDVKFSGNHGVQLLLDTERAQTLGNWYDPGTAILDASNLGRGEIKYEICVSNVGSVSGPISVSGGSYLTITDYKTAITTFAPSGNVVVPQIYIGTDLRLVALTGGGKLQARNPGTNTWADVDQWTNP